MFYWQTAKETLRKSLKRRYSVHNDDTAAIVPFIDISVGGNNRKSSSQIHTEEVWSILPMN